MQVGVRCRRLLGPGADSWVGLLDHLLAEVHADEVVLKNVVIEHVLGGLAEVDDPLAHRRRPNVKRHVLGVDGTGGMVVAADAADAAGDEVGVADPCLVIYIMTMTVPPDGKTMKIVMDDKLHGTTTKGDAMKQ